MSIELTVLLIGCVLNFWCGWYFGRRDLYTKVGTPSASHNTPKVETARPAALCCECAKFDVCDKRYDCFEPK